jgi:ribose transport system substrate-binding protein
MRRTLGRRAGLAVAAVLLLVLAGCGGDEPADDGAAADAPAATDAAATDDMAQTEAAATAPTATDDGATGAAGGDYDIVLIPGVIGDEFYVSMECGAREAAEAAGATLDVQGPDAFDPTQQTPVLEAVIASQPDAILIAPTDTTAMQAPIQQAVDAGITVVLVDTTLDDPSVAVSAIASDNVEGGRMAADALGELIEGEGSVMVINVNPGISTTDQRQQGFEEGVAAYDNLNYIGTEFSNNEPTRAAEIVGATLAAEPDLIGIFGTNLFSAEGAATGVRNAGPEGEDIRIVGFDAGPAQVDQLQQGQVQALIVQKPLDIGRQGVEQAILALNGEETEAEITTDFVTATQDNLEDPDIAEFLYRSSC